MIKNIHFSFNLVDVFYIVTGGSRKLTISNLLFHPPLCSVRLFRIIWKNGKQRKVTAVLLGRVLAPCTIGSKEIGSEGVGARD